MKLSILIPVYNQGATIDRVLRSIVAAGLPSGIEREVVVINDGSTDRTAPELEAFRQAHTELALVYHQERVNHGKGWCLRRGIAMATGDCIVIQDADLEYDPADHAVMLRPILKDRADVVYGSRFLNGARVTTRWHRAVNRGLTTLTNRFAGLRLTDVHTGLKLFRSDLLKNLPLVEDRFGFCPEVTARLAKIPGVRWAEVPVAYHPRSHAQGKKIGFRDGLRALYCIGRYTWPWRRREVSAKRQAGSGKREVESR